MNLTISNINNTSFKAQNKASKQPKVLTSNVSAKIDKSCDGKFSISEAGKNLVKGIISPVTNMFSNPKNFAIGAGMIAASSAIIAATGGAAAPLFVIAGFGAGAFQAGKAGYKIIKAKNGDDIEKAFYDIGGAATTIGLSAASSRASLKQANIQTEALGKFASVKKCFTSAKDLTKESFNVLKSGYYKTNLKSAFTVLKNPQSLRKYSDELAIESKKNFENSYNQFKDILPEEFKGSLKGRAKCQVSIYEKMVKERNSLIKQINEIRKNKDFSFSEKIQKIKEIKAQITKIDTDANVAKGLVEDTYGARIVEGSPKKIEKLVTSLEKAAKDGKIEILEIENYRGSNHKFYNNNEYYFTEKQMNRLGKFCDKTKIKNESKSSGYTAVQLKVKPKNGKVLELQIRGKEVNNVGDWEHIPYDIRQGKDIAKGNNELGCKLADVRNAANKLSKTQKTQYQKYIYENYMYAQAQEFGKTMTAPKLPDGINPVLSSDNLSKLHASSSKSVARGVKNPLDIRPQIAIVSAKENQTKNFC